MVYNVNTLLAAPWWPGVMQMDTLVQAAVAVPATVVPEELLARLSHSPRQYQLMFACDDHWSLTIDGWKLIGPSEGASDAINTFWRLSVPTLDLRQVGPEDLELGCALIPLPNLCSLRRMSPKPWNALSYAPLAHVMGEWRGLNAFAANIPENDHALPDRRK